MAGTFIDPSDGMLYRMGTFGPVLVGKAHGKQEERDEDEENDEDL